MSAAQPADGVNKEIFLAERNENRMLISKYPEELQKIENRFYEYKKDAETIIRRTSAMIDRTVITKGAIANFTPFHEERMGFKLNGKIITQPIQSNYCMKYHYDSSGRIIMVEEYSVFLNHFMLTEIYLYGKDDDSAEKLFFSSGTLERLFVVDHAFENTKRCLSFARRTGCAVEEFVYEDGVLKEVNIGRNDGDHKDTLIYEKDKLIMIKHTWSNGNSKISYTTKKPNFKIIKSDIYNKLRRRIDEQNGKFKAIGIEGFLDQQPSVICVCFTGEEHPGELIADWKTEMESIRVYDWQFNSEQERKAVKIVAEIIVGLVDEGVLLGKEIYFHQNQVCVSQLYSGAKTVFKKAGLCVK